MKDSITYALDYLSRYPKTAVELQQQLHKKWYDEEEVTKTVARLQELSYLDDAEFARNYLLGEVGRRGKSLALCKAKLQSRGIDKAVIMQVVEELADELTVGIQHKIASLVDRFETAGLAKQQILQKLQSRGYSYGDIEAMYKQKPE